MINGGSVIKVGEKFQDLKQIISHRFHGFSQMMRFFRATNARISKY